MAGPSGGNVAIEEYCGAEAEGGSFEWEPGAAKNKFTSLKKPETGNAVFETANGTQISCKGEADVGEYLGESEDHETVTFTGCEAFGSKCNSEGAATGEIRTAQLRSLYGFISRPKAIGVSLEPLSGSVFAEFSCGPAPTVLRGSVIVKAGSIVSGKFKSSTNKMLNKLLLELGSEAPEKFEGEPPDVLEGSTAGSSFEKAALTLNTIEQTNPKTTKVELRQCEKNVC